MKIVMIIFFNHLSKFLSGYGLRKRFTTINTLYLLIKSKLTPNRINLDGHIIYLDPGDSLGLSTEGIYEPLETRIIQKLVEPGDVVLDIGANIGYYTLQFARLVGHHGQVIAFEPEENSYKLLKKNVEVNNYKNVDIYQVAVSDKIGELDLYIDTLGNLDHQIFASSKNRKKQITKCVSLDELLNKQEKIDFIKMDIQGAEVKAIKGMRNILIENPEVILLTEFWPLGLELIGSNPSEFLESLQHLGFRFYDINNPYIFLENTSLEALKTKYPSQYHIHTNLVCLRSAAHHKNINILL